VECGVVFEKTVFQGTRDEKAAAHAAFMAALLDDVIRRTNGFVLLLPHSIEPGKSDLPVAHKIAASMREKNLFVLEADLPARTLKAIISQLDFIISERAHCLMNSFAAHTPFVGLTNRYDLRTHCQELLFDLDGYPLEEAIGHVREMMVRRAAFKQTISVQNKLMQGELERLAGRFFPGVAQPTQAAREHACRK
jgi:polysaccharide pyruvyl transferase WcaK-like protein